MNSPPLLQSKDIPSKAGGTRPTTAIFRILTRQGPDAPGGEVDYMVSGKMVTLQKFVTVADHLIPGVTFR